MRRQLLCAVCILAAIVFYIYTRTPTALFLMCAVILFPLIAIPFALLCAKRVRLSLNIPDTVQKGTPAHGSLLIENPSFIPLSGLELVLHIRNTLTGRETHATFSCAVPPRGRDKVEFILDSAYCGQYIISCKEFRIYDFLGLRGINKPLSIREKRIIPPETFSVNVTLTDGERTHGSSEPFSIPQKGQDYSETFQIREYVDGDSIRQIHWKLSQKLDRYIVTDPSLESERTLLILWDSDSFSGNISPQIPDALAESLISLSLSLAEAEIPHCVAWKNGETGNIELQEVDGPDDVYAVISGILCATSGKADSSLMAEFLHELNLRAYPKIAYFSHQLPSVADLQISDKITVFICSEEYSAGDSDEFDCRVLSPENYSIIMQNVII